MTSTETGLRTRDDERGAKPSRPAVVHSAWNRAQHLRPLRWLALLLFPLGSGLASIAIGQDITGDTLLYHWYDVWAYLHGRELVDVFPARFQTLINPIEDVPFYLLDRHVGPLFGAFVAGFEQGLSPLIVYLIGHRITRSRWIALIAALAAAIAGGFVSELGSMMGDTTVSPFFLLAVLFAVVAMQRQGTLGPPIGRHATTAGVVLDDPRTLALHRSTWWWLASGLTLGVGMGLKFAEASMAVGMVVGALFMAGTWRARLRASFASGVGVLVGNVVTAGDWTVFLWHHYGDPFAFTGAPFWIFSSKYFPGGATPSAWHGPSSFFQGLYFPVYWFFHATAIVGIPLREASLPIAYILVVVLFALFCARLLIATAARAKNGGTASQVPATPSRDERVDAGIDRYLIATFVVTLIIWVRLFAVYRYIIPLELVSPLVIVAAGRRSAVIAGRLRPNLRVSPRALVVAFAAICALCVATESPGNYWARIPFGTTNYRVATPAMLRNGKLNAIVELGGNADSFVLPELRSHFIAIGGIGDLLTSATRDNLRAAFAKVRRSGGNVVGFWVSSNPGGNQAAFIGQLGDPGLRQQYCVNETLYVGYGYEGIGFCKYVPSGPKTSAAG